MPYRNEDDDDRDEDYEEPAPRMRASRSGNWTCLIVVLSTCGLAGMLLCCGGGGALVWFGLNVVSKEIESQLRDNEALIEHIGELESLTIDLIKTGEEDKPETLAYRVKGSKGTGVVIVVSSPDANGRQIVRSAILRLPDGTEVPLIP